MKFRIVAFSLSAFILSLGVIGCNSQAKAQAEREAAERRALLSENTALVGRVAKEKRSAEQAQANVVFKGEFEKVGEVEAEAAEKLKEGTEKKDNALVKEANALAKKAGDQYETLRIRSDNRDLKDKIKEFELDKFSGEDFERANEASQKASSMYRSEPQMALNSAREAETLYLKVISDGFKHLSTDIKKTVEKTRTDVTELKVASSLQEQQAQAESSFQNGVKMEDTGNFEPAYLNYKTAQTQFDDLKKVIETKKAEAEKAMNAAKMQQKKASVVATEADRKAPLAKDAEGFSPEPIKVEPLPSDVLERSVQKEGANQ